jgi:hypothetical protein
MVGEEPGSGPDAAEPGAWTGVAEARTAVAEARVEEVEAAMRWTVTP